VFSKLDAGDLISINGEERVVLRVMSDTELEIASPFPDEGLNEHSDYMFTKAIARFTDSDENTKFLVTSSGNVGIGSWISDERLTIESSDNDAEVADVLFRTSVSPWDTERRQSSMRLRSGWHNTESEEEGSQRTSIDGFVAGEWSEVVTFRADGNVGVGTSDPTESLHVAGNSYVEGDIFVGPAGGTQLAVSVDEAGMLSIGGRDGDAAISVSLESDGAVGLGVDDARARLHAQGSAIRYGIGMVSSSDGVAVLGSGTRFLEELNVGDLFAVMGSTRHVQSIESDNELHLSSGVEPFSESSFSFQKAITLMTSNGGETEFVVTADGNVGICSWISDERLTIESSDSNVEVADVLFRTSVSPWDTERRQSSMRLRSGWHNTDSEEEGSQRTSIDGFVAGEWSEVATFRADGNVGVGTSDPRESLHVVGNTFVEGDFLVGPHAESSFSMSVNEEGLLRVQDVSGRSALSLSTAARGSVGVNVEVPLAQLHAAGSGRRMGQGAIQFSGVVGHGDLTRFTSELSVGDVIVVFGEERHVQSISSDSELTVSSPFESVPMAAGMFMGFEYEKPNLKLSSDEGDTEFVVTANGNVGIGSWISDERLTIESSDGNAEVADVLFRASVSPWDTERRQSSMRLRSGWHNTDSEEEGSQRTSIDGFVAGEWTRL
jgi:hypothetical protein